MKLRRKKEKKTDQSMELRLLMGLKQQEQLAVWKR